MQKLRNKLWSPKRRSIRRQHRHLLATVRRMRNLSYCFGFYWAITNEFFDVCDFPSGRFVIAYRFYELFDFLRLREERTTDSLCLKSSSSLTESYRAGQSSLVLFFLFSLRVQRFPKRLLFSRRKFSRTQPEAVHLVRVFRAAFVHSVWTFQRRSKYSVFQLVHSRTSMFLVRHFKPRRNIPSGCSATWLQS